VNCLMDMVPPVSEAADPAFSQFTSMLALIDESVCEGPNRSLRTARGRPYQRNNTHTTRHANPAVLSQVRSLSSLISLTRRAARLT